MATKNTKSWAERLKEIRLKHGISQRNLGIAAGIDPFAASARLNRYEKGVHDPDPGISQRIAAALNVPNALLYADDDDLAELIETFSRLTEQQKQEVIATAKQLLVSG